METTTVKTGDLVVSTRVCHDGTRYRLWSVTGTTRETADLKMIGGFERPSDAPYGPVCMDFERKLTISPQIARPGHDCRYHLWLHAAPTTTPIDDNEAVGWSVQTICLGERPCPTDEGLRAGMRRTHDRSVVGVQNAT